MAIVVAVAIVGSAKAIKRTIEKRSNEQSVKTETKNEAKRLRVTIFDIAKLEEW